MDRATNTDFPTLMSEIRSSSLSEPDKLAKAFDLVTSSIIEHAEREIELARALQDQQAKIKHQIKLESIKHAREVFKDCCLLVLGKRVWDD